MRGRFELVASFICAICGVLSSGCSFLFVTKAPDDIDKLPPSEPVECTTSRGAPVVDMAATAFQIVRTAPPPTAPATVTPTERREAPAPAPAGGAGGAATPEDPPPPSDD